jgi:hypothetical protein
MHCYDNDYSVFSILPPFNTVNAQVIRAGASPVILNNTQASVVYSAVADRTRSINTTSEGKTNFWSYVAGLFGVTLPTDQGLTGSRMPGASNGAQSFLAFDPVIKWFTAEGIPITSYDDRMKKNPYPLMNIQPYETGSAVIPAPLSVVLPVSDEMHCSDCHNNGGKGANNAVRKKYGITSWSRSASSKVRYRENILILHDATRGTSLLTATPVLCASCHYSPALDLTGAGPTGNQIGKSMLSMAVHGKHGKAVDGTIPSATKPAIIPDTGVAACYKCHPGSVTKCLRGAMGAAGITCQNCHGGMLAVGGAYAARTPWVNEPKCQSCHTGDAMSHQGPSIRSRIAYDPGDPAATPLTATNQRFAENAAALYRNSTGHGGLACQACHGSTHAEWPTGTSLANDNLAAKQIQGHAGPVIECVVCHGSGQSRTTNGPHGLHNVNSASWNTGHGSFFESNQAGCQACHGATLQGTVLSRAAANRLLMTDDNRTVYVAKGSPVPCTLCHENPLNGGGNSLSRISSPRKIRKIQ